MARTPTFDVPVKAFIETVKGHHRKTMKCGLLICNISKRVALNPLVFYVLLQLTRLTLSYIPVVNQHILDFQATIVKIFKHKKNRKMKDFNIMSYII